MTGQELCITPCVGKSRAGTSGHLLMVAQPMGLWRQLATAVRRARVGRPGSLTAQDSVRSVIVGTTFLLLTANAFGQSQLTIRAIDLLPNAPSTYQMRDWHTVATNFDTLAFDATATGQYYPLVKIDNSPQSQQLQTSFGLAAYVGETRTFGETGEPVHEAITSLAAVLGGTLVGIDKTAGAYNWVSMTREYYVNRNSQFVVLNTPFSASGGSAWYDIYPNMLFYSIADRYPDESYFAPILNQIDQRFYDAVGVLTANGSAPNFNYTAYNFRTRQPVYNGVWREPDMGMGMAWMHHAAYWRNQDTNPALAAQYLTAVDWALSYYQQTTSNPDYEIMAPFGAYTAARMNAEHGRNYDIQKLVNWVFDRSVARPTKIMIGGGPWGGQDVGGLMGFTVPNVSDVRGYAFSMNTFATAMPMVPLARYEDRYSRDIGKWMLNTASAARLFYANAHSNANQSSEFWTGDPQSAIAYEGLRHHWLGGEFDGEELYAAGDPLTYGWGPETDFGLYGSAMTGVFGSIIKTTNVDKVLQLDLLATDFYRGSAYSTYLYYNPHAASASVAIELGNDQLVDLYDAAANRFVARGVSGTTYFDVAADDAVMLVKIPAGGKQTFAGRQMLIDGVVVDFNAAQLPGNLVRNADVDTASTSNPNRPGFWHGSINANWSTAEAVSPTHSLEVTDTSVSRSEEWRSFANAIPDGTDRTLNLRWFWKSDTNDEFIARLRLSGDEVLGVDLTHPVASHLFTITGTSGEFELFEAAIPLPAGIHSFDLTYISGAANSAVGSLFIDDISASLLPTSAFFMLESDFNGDGAVDGADLAVWQQGYGTHFDGADFTAWQRNYRPVGGGISALQTVVPEPSAFVLAGFISAVLLCGSRAEVHRLRSIQNQ
jgi:hypothetical protein